MISIIGLALSVVAIIVSSWTAVRQMIITRKSSNLQATTDVLIAQFGDRTFQADQRYVVTRLREEHDPQLGIDALPEPATAKAWNVGFMYENLGIMLAFGLVDRRIILSIGNYRLRQVWEALAPYIETERRMRGAPFLNFFENAYVQARETEPTDIYHRLSLRTVESLGTAPTTTVDH
ncbi:hypothetical protein ACIA8K_03865 [Catenuloplanes sp. NPDC051500]|uniref:DUF4760 domain-containing protein n=1 Tax=Catenuloplanes sp. NPDC051500 TaxID=3363959 RepID=UPI0037B5A72F